MAFKLTITQTGKDGLQSKIELENSEALQDQGAMLAFLQPLIQNPELASFTALKYEEAFQEMPEPDAALDPIASDTDGSTLELITEETPPVKKISDREKGIAEIHCPTCGRITSQMVPVKNSFVWCPSKDCKTKLFLYPLHEVRGEPNAQGVSFKASRLYKSFEERVAAKDGY